MVGLLRYLRLRIAQPPERNPLAFCFCAFMAFSIWPIALGFERLPGSLERAPYGFGEFAALMLFVGCLVTIAGIVLPKRDAGLAAELAGALLAGPGLVFYGAAVILAAMPPPNAAIVAGMCGGIALGFAVRIAQILLYTRARTKGAA